MRKQPLQMKMCIDTFRPRQHGRHFTDEILKCIFFNENIWISIKISLKFVPKGPINNIPAMVQIMAWRQPGDKPLSEPMMVSLLMHIYAPLGLSELRMQGVWFCLKVFHIYRKHMISMPHTTVMHVGIAKPRWRGKRSQHSPRTCNPQFYVSAKRPMVNSSHWQRVVRQDTTYVVVLLINFFFLCSYVPLRCNVDAQVIYMVSTENLLCTGLWSCTIFFVIIIHGWQNIIKFIKIIHCFLHFIFRLNQIFSGM